MIGGGKRFLVSGKKKVKSLNNNGGKKTGELS